jgi:hypothetical protein
VTQSADRDAYLRRVGALLASLSDRLTVTERGEVQHLIDHGEPAEGMRTLAWIIVEQKKKVPGEAIASLRQLSHGLIDNAHMPPNLDDCADD